MPGTTIGITMTYSYPGQASRHGDEVSRTRAVNTDSGQNKGREHGLGHQLIGIAEFQICTHGSGERKCLPAFACKK